MRSPLRSPLRTLRFTKHAFLSLMSLLFFGISHIPLCNAANNGPFNYYQSPPLALLENIENFHLAQGIDKTKEEKLEYAWSEFAFLLHYFPNHPAALNAIGDLSIQINQPQRAAKYFERALKLYPDEAATYADYGSFLTKIGKVDDAITQYKRALALNETNPNYHYQLGLAYFTLHHYALANRSAQSAYQHGMPDNTLKDKLLSVNAWKPKAG